MAQKIRIMEIALSAFIEDAIQSENGLSKADEKFIAEERERIRKLKLKLAA